MLPHSTSSMGASSPPAPAAAPRGKRTSSSTDGNVNGNVNGHQLQPIASPQSQSHASPISTATSSAMYMPHGARRYRSRSRSFDASFISRLQAYDQQQQQQQQHQYHAAVMDPRLLHMQQLQHQPHQRDNAENVYVIRRGSGVATLTTPLLNAAHQQHPSHPPLTSMQPLPYAFPPDPPLNLPSMEPYVPSTVASAPPQSPPAPSPTVTPHSHAAATFSSTSRRHSSQQASPQMVSPWDGFLFCLVRDDSYVRRSA